MKWKKAVFYGKQYPGIHAHALPAILGSYAREAYMMSGSILPYPPLLLITFHDADGTSMQSLKSSGIANSEALCQRLAAILDLAQGHGIRRASISNAG